LFLLCFKKIALRAFVFFCHFCVSKKMLYGLLCSFVTFVFQKNALRTFVYFCYFCVSKTPSTIPFCNFDSLLPYCVPRHRRTWTTRRTLNHSTYFCVLLKNVVVNYGLLCSFVSFVFQKNRSTGFCVLLSLLCFKKNALRTFVFFCYFCVSKKCSTDFCVLLLLLCFKNPLYYTLLQFRLLAPVLCSATSSGEDDSTYDTSVLKKYTTNP